MRKQLIVQCTTIMSCLHTCQTLSEQTKNREAVSVLNPNPSISLYCDLYLLWQRCGCGLARFRCKTHLIRVRKTSCIGLKCLLFLKRNLKLRRLASQPCCLHVTTSASSPSSCSRHKGKLIYMWSDGTCIVEISILQGWQVQYRWSAGVWTANILTFRVRE